MKKLKVFFALLISLALMLTLCCAASAEDEPAWALSMDGDTLTCLDNYYVRLNTAQFGVDIGEVIYKTESLAVTACAAIQAATLFGWLTASICGPRGCSASLMPRMRCRESC